MARRPSRSRSSPSANDLSLQVTVVGLFIIAVFYAITGGLLVLFERTARPGRWRWAIIAPLGVIALAAPWVDEAWIAWHFNELCKDAGVHVVRKVEVDGFYDDTMRSGYALIDRLGYKFVEHPSVDRKRVERIEKPQGKWQTTFVDKPTARYHYKKPRNDADAGYQIAAIEYVVVDSQTGEVIGRKVIYKRYPGWANALLVRHFGSGMTMCPDPERGPRQLPFPETVLIPTRAR